PRRAGMPVILGTVPHAWRTGRIGKDYRIGGKMQGGERRQKAEDRRQKAEGRSYPTRLLFPSVCCLLPPVFCLALVSQTRHSTMLCTACIQSAFHTAGRGVECPQIRR